MNAWVVILVPSALVGIICAYFIKGRLSIVLSGAIPWFGVLVSLLYEEYFVPYQGGGASMWPIALIFAGTAAAGAGVVVNILTKNILGKVGK